MRAGSGIIHSEMPRQENGMMWGYQLWVNLPAALKMTEPRYQDLQAHEIPVIESKAYTARVLSGSLGGVQGGARDFFPIDYFDVHFIPEQSAEIPVAADRSAFVSVFWISRRLGKYHAMHDQIRLRPVAALLQALVCRWLSIRPSLFLHFVQPAKIFTDLPIFETL